MKQSDMNEDDDIVSQLLRKAGRGSMPSKIATQQAYSVVHAAWKFELRGRSRMRQAALAAGLVALVVTGIWMFRPQTEVSPLAQVAQLRGKAVRLHGTRDSVSLANGALLVEGDEIYSGSNSRMVLQRSSGLNIVLGANTRVQWRSHDDLHLLTGALYVDTGINAASDPFSVSTDAGVIRHVGTQFTVIMRGDAVRVAVRQGSVRLHARDRSATVVHGEQAVLLKSGEMLRDQVTETTGAWNWLWRDAAQFAIEDRSLFDVLADIADASGTRINYASNETEQQVRQLKLHGPPLNLEPTAALNAVLLTTQLTVNRTSQAITIGARAN